MRKLILIGVFAGLISPSSSWAWGERGQLSYGELAQRALAVAAWLQRCGVGPGELVGISLPKGPEQIIAVLGVLAAGAAYVPVGVNLPTARQQLIYARAGVRLVLNDLAEPVASPPLAEPVFGRADDLAYVIFTSGSTGEPKGVEMTHAAAENTIESILGDFNIGEDDRVLAGSSSRS